MTWIYKFMNRMRFLIMLSLLLTTPLGFGHPCDKDALEHSKKLLALHVDNDDRAVVEEKVTILPSIKNPVNKSQTFDVLETWGLVYKGKYRMHMIYWVDETNCLLMGQEILEFANL